MTAKANNCVQATPGDALLFILAQVSGAPDAERWADHAPFVRNHLPLCLHRSRLRRFCGWAVGKDFDVSTRVGK